MSRGHKSLILAVLVTVIAIAAHSWLPPRQMDLLSKPVLNTYLYYDATDGGGTMGRWLDSASHHFRCEHVELVKPSTYCGMSMELVQGADLSQGVDFSPYTAIILDIELDSTQPRISVILRSFNPDYSEAGNVNTAQHMVVTLRRQDLDQPVTVGFNEFSVSEWWLIDRDIPRSFTLPDFNNIVVMGIDVRDRLGPGAHDVKLKRAVLTGPWVKAESWYLGILATWLIGLVTYLVVRSLHWKSRAKGNEKKLKKLASRHRELRGEAQELKQRSERDSLSGLLNRLGFEEAFERMDTSLEAPVAVILIDIDHFKRINDRRGHAEGDRVIREVSSIISRNTRAQDILARWGGEEFLLVCPRTSLAQAFQLAEKIRHCIFSANYFADRPLAVSASLGVAELRQGESFTQLFNRVDECLYRAKGLGRNCTVLESEG